MVSLRRGEVNQDMTKLSTLAGGLLGSFAFLKTPLSGTFLGGLDPVVDIIGVVGMLVFSGALIYNGVREFFQR
jgi:hypothetical protein